MDPFQKFGGKPNLQPPKPNTRLVSAADNLKVFNRNKQLSNTPNGLQIAKKGVTTNQMAIESDRYYNPEVRDVHSGDKLMDALYRNQWLFDTPVVGSLIKNQAYNLVKNSGGEHIYNKASKPNYDKNERQGKVYRGTLDDVGDLPKNHLQGADLLSQYFDKTSLPASKYKPKSDYLPFLPSVSIKQDFDKNIPIQDLTDIFKDLPELTEQRYKDVIQKGLPFYKAYDQESALSSKLNVDLGGHKVGVAFDKDKKLPYVSISDAWDFSPKDYSETYVTRSNGDEKKDPSYVQASLMHKAGKPFKVYDRFYFDPKTKKYIPDDKIK